MVLGLTLLTEPNLSLATTQQVDGLKKIIQKKNWPLTPDGQGSTQKNIIRKKKLTLDPQRGQGSNLTSLTLIFLATNKLFFYINKLNSKKICFIFLTFFLKKMQHQSHEASMVWVATKHPSIILFFRHKYHLYIHNEN